ncbi:hypothetical protein EDD11_007930 [Mortierella claussenii]|nr:hypothetical protein EDD11_007930 [Mortierella claussenii]
MSQELNITARSPRPSAVQFSSSSEQAGGRHQFDSHPLPAHNEQEEISISELKSIPLTKTVTSESLPARLNGRRSSLTSFTDRFRPRSHSRPRSSGSQSNSNNNNTMQSNSSESGLFKDRRKSTDNDYQFKYSNRRSSDFTGAYADIARAQALFMEKLREEQERKSVKKNVDGLPIPPPVQRRRSSVTQMLGMDKPLLSR